MEHFALSMCAGLLPTQEIAANHVLEKFVSDPRIDSWSDLLVPTEEVLHVHCQQGADRFNKEQFFMHHYRNLDVLQLDRRVLRDCVTMLAVGSFRVAMNLQLGVQ